MAGKLCSIDDGAFGERVIVEDRQGRPLASCTGDVRGNHLRRSAARAATLTCFPDPTEDYRRATQ